tara:strand:- start:489 stop:635 length:147 start_codon:yes stop_codon:yes gene_type:complete
VTYGGSGSVRNGVYGRLEKLAYGKLEKLAWTIVIGQSCWRRIMTAVTK